MKKIYFTPTVFLILFLSVLLIKISTSEESKKLLREPSTPNNKNIKSLRTGIETNNDNAADESKAPTNSKYTIKFEENDTFSKANSGIQNFKDRCVSLVGKYQFVTNIDANNLIIKTAPILLKMTKDNFQLLLQDDETFKIFDLKTSFIVDISELMKDQKDLPCIAIKFEEITNSKLVKVHNINVCGRTLKEITVVKDSWTELFNACVTKDPLIVQDFRELNRLVKSATAQLNGPVDIFESVTYINPKKEKSPREIQKELLKGKIEVIKTKMLEKKFSEKELCRKEKLKAMDEKLDQEEEDRLKKLNAPVESKESPILSDSNSEALKSLANIEKTLNNQLSTVKNAIESNGVQKQ